MLKVAYTLTFFRNVVLILIHGMSFCQWLWVGYPQKSIFRAWEFYWRGYYYKRMCWGLGLDTTGNCWYKILKTSSLYKQRDFGYNITWQHKIYRWKGLFIMLAAVRGYYNGNHIVINEDISLNAGQEVIVTILDTQSVPENRIGLKKYMGRGKKMFHIDAQDYVREMRDSDRI